MLAFDQGGSRVSLGCAAVELCATCSIACLTDSPTFTTAMVSSTDTDGSLKPRSTHRSIDRRPSRRSCSSSDRLCRAAEEVTALCCRRVRGKIRTPSTTMQCWISTKRPCREVGQCAASPWRCCAGAQVSATRRLRSSPCIRSNRAQRAPFAHDRRSASHAPHRPACSPQGVLLRGASACR